MRPIGTTVPTLFALTFVWAAAGPGIRADEEPRWDVGIRANIMGGTGEPANDVLGAGLCGRYFVNSKWAIGAAYDGADFDFERPWKTVGLVQDPSIADIDAKSSMDMLSAWAERRYTRNRNEWYWTGGLGVSDVTADTASGPTDTGGTFEITTDAGTEFVLSVGVGYRRVLARHWWLDAGFRLEWHDADWKVRDSVSGNTGTIDGYRLLGVGLGFGYRF